MQDWIDIISTTPTSLTLKLRHADDFDEEIFERIANDANCLPCSVINQAKGIINYSIHQYVSLDVFLKEVSFEREEGYCFLHNLFDQAIAVNRNKPVLFDPDFVYVSEYGDTFSFVVIPIKPDKWMYRKDTTEAWIEYVCRNFRTTTAFEIPGFLLSFLHAEEFSLPNLVLGLENIRMHYYPSHFLFFKTKQKKTNDFRIQDPVRIPYLDTSSEIEPVLAEDGDKTQLIASANAVKGYLVCGDDKYELISETMIIGRSMACDIRLKDETVSLKHAKITCQNERYYIQDLKSSNGTILEGKKVARKMRLRDGMHIYFGNEGFIFHQS